jgi:cytochrome c-type biogenesis protein CcmH
LVLAAFGLLTLVALSPLLWSLWRAKSPRGRRDSDLALHRAQLAELDRELAEGRIGPAEHAGARLEVQRRLLAAADQPEASPARRGMALLMAALILVPLLAQLLYVIDGHPELPDVNAASQRPDTAQEQRDADQLIATLRQRLTELDAKTDLAAQGYLLLGNAEASRGRLPEATAAWRQALAVNFDPNLAAQTAEAEFQSVGTLNPATRALFQKALDNAPPNAAWRGLVQQRLAGG